MSGHSTTSQGTGNLPQLAAPAHRALAGAGISNLKQLAKFTEAEVKVDIRGTPLVVLDVGIEDGYMAARDMLGRSLGYFVDHVIPVLEQFLPDRQPERPT